METFDRVGIHRQLDDWIDGGCVGNFIIYHAPTGEKFCAIIEQTIKAREMDQALERKFTDLLDSLDCTKGEFHKKDGKADRLKIVRQL